MLMLDRILTEQAVRICKTYKISLDEAKKQLAAKLTQNSKLTELIDNSTDLSKIHKNKEFKNILKQVKKDIYYSLRTYQRESEDIQDTHTSTQERKLFITDFINQLDGYLQSATIILDIGGGLFVTSFDLAKYNNIQEYIWLDKDAISYEKLKKYKEEKNIPSLKLFNHSIGQHPWEYYTKAPVELALMLKLIPVVARQEKDLLQVLASVPAKNILLTGSKEALVKKTDIQKREDTVIKQFINLTHKQIQTKLDIPNEFGYVIS